MLGYRSSASASRSEGSDICGDPARKAAEEPLRVHTSAQRHRRPSASAGHWRCLTSETPKPLPCHGKTRLNFALPWENKESFPFKSKLLRLPSTRSGAGLSGRCIVPSCPVTRAPGAIQQERCPSAARRKVNMSLSYSPPGPFPTTMMVGPMLWRLPRGHTPR